MRQPRTLKPDHDGVSFNHNAEAADLGTITVAAEGGKGRTGREKGRVTPVNNGHSKTNPDQGRNALTRDNAEVPSWVRFPPAPLVGLRTPAKIRQCADLGPSTRRFVR